MPLSDQPEPTPLEQIHEQRQACMRALDGMIGEDNTNEHAILATAVKFLVAQLPSRLALESHLRELGQLVVDVHGQPIPTTPPGCTIQTDESSGFIRDEVSVRLTWTMRSGDAGGFLDRLRAWAAEQPQMMSGVDVTHRKRYTVKDIEPDPTRSGPDRLGWPGVRLVTYATGTQSIQIDACDLDAVDARELAAGVLSAVARAEVVKPQAGDPGQPPDPWGDGTKSTLPGTERIVTGVREARNKRLVTYTEHGHAYPYVPGSGGRRVRPRLIAKCGGPGVCAECAVEAGWGAGLGDNGAYVEPTPVQLAALHHDDVAEDQ